jgi:predicted MFS family arabinose efflux permease
MSAIVIIVLVGIEAVIANVADYRTRRKLLDRKHLQALLTLGAVLVISLVHLARSPGVRRA